MVTLLIVWGALPFVVITRLRRPRAGARTSSSRRREIDGAGPMRIFRDVTFPVLKPILLILTSLSIIWDFGVFAQPYLLIGSSHIDPTNYLMGVYVFIKGYADHDFGRGAAISLLMLLMVAGMSVFYVRQMVKAGNVNECRSPLRRAAARRKRRRRAAWAGTSSALAIFVVMIFPVYWMFSTAFKSTDDINRLTPTWFPVHPTLQHFRDAMDRPYFWSSVVNSVIIVVVTVAVSIALAFLAAVALSKFRFTGREVFIVAADRDPDAPAGRSDHPALRRAREATS